MRVFHYTPIEKYRQIWAERFLEAKSPLISSGWDLTELGVEIPDDKFIFGFINTPEPEGWVQSGYLDVFRNIYLKRRQTALLSFILNKENAFVLEARPTFDFYEGRLGAPIAFQEYVASMVPVAQYSGNYEMPELVIAGDISIQRIDLESRL